MNLAPASPSCGVVVPAFNESVRLGDVLKRIVEHAPGMTVIVVDDGSTDDTSAVARALGADVIRHEKNLGKGAALISGLAHAREKGFELVITLDADGQHDPAAIPRFIDTWRRTRIPVLIGNRMWDRQRMPPVRRWTNGAMSWLLSRLMGVYVADTQCGFRLFRADLLPYMPVASPRFAMESEILLSTAARGIRMDSVRIPVLYGGQVSRVRPFVDTWRFVMMLLRFRRHRLLPAV